jgi:hypothetical protein
MPSKRLLAVTPPVVCAYQHCYCIASTGVFDGATVTCDMQPECVSTGYFLLVVDQLTSGSSICFNQRECQRWKATSAAAVSGKLCGSTARAARMPAGSVTTTKS